MRKTKMSRPVSRLFAIGLLLVTVPNLLRGFLTIPDFFRGLPLGLGMGLMICGIILQKKEGNTCSSFGGAHDDGE